MVNNGWEENMKIPSTLSISFCCWWHLLRVSQHWFFNLQHLANPQAAPVMGACLQELLQPPLFFEIVPVSPKRMLLGIQLHLRERHCIDVQLLAAFDLPLGFFWRRELVEWQHYAFSWKISWLLIVSIEFKGWNNLFKISCEISITSQLCYYVYASCHIGISK